MAENVKQMEKLVLNLDKSRRENEKLHSDNMNLELAFKPLKGLSHQVAQRQDH